MSADGALIVKLWLHLDKQDQVKQLEQRACKQQNQRVTDRPYEIHGHYDRYVEVASELMQETSTEHSPWHVIDASRRRHRELEAGRLLLAAMQRSLDEAGALPAPPTFTPATATPRLDALDLGLKLERSKYKEELKALQRVRDPLQSLCADGRVRDGQQDVHRLTAGERRRARHLPWHRRRRDCGRGGGGVMAYSK